MSQIVAKYMSKIFMIHKVEPFEVKIFNSRVSIRSEREEFSIIINGRKSAQKLHELLADIESLLFFYIGSFPLMTTLKINGEDEDISQRVGKFHTSSIFIKHNLVICDISANTITEQKLLHFKQVNQMALYSLQFLLSESYEHVITNHKMTLLLHVVQGIYDDSRCLQDKQAIKNKYPAATGKVGDYMASVYWLCNEFFFRYHRKYGCDILALLGVNQYQFLCKLTDTRNWYSHFLAETKKPLRIRNGREFIIYFEIICYAIRLAVIETLGGKPEEGRIREFYYTVHDWILEICYNKNEPLKSQVYKDAQSLKIFKEKITRLEG